MNQEQLIALRKNLTKQVNTFKNWVNEAENKIKWIDKQLK